MRVTSTSLVALLQSAQSAADQFAKFRTSPFSERADFGLAIMHGAA
jgi:hypothetical protein